MTHAGLIITGLARKPARTLLTMSSLAVAFLMFGLLQPVAQVFAGSLQLAKGNRLIVSPKHSISDMLPLRYVNRVQQIPGVAVVSHQTWFGGSYKDDAGTFTRWAVPPMSFMKVHPEFRLPKVELDAFIRTRTGAIVGRQTANRYQMKVGHKIPLKTDIWFNPRGAAWTFDLVGIYDGTSRQPKPPDGLGVISHSGMGWHEYRTDENRPQGDPHPDRSDRLRGRSSRRG